MAPKGEDRLTAPQRWTGHEARLLRTALRLSVRAFAARLGVAERTISTWEKGGRATRPWPHNQAILDTALSQADGEAQARFAQFLADGKAAAQPQAPLQGSGELGTDDALPVLHSDEQSRVAAALGDVHRYLDGTVVDYFHRQLDAAEADDGTRGPTTVLPVVLGILGAIDRQAREVKLQVRCELLSVAARGAEFAGWLYRDVQKLDCASFWYGRATEWAQEAGDLPMQGYVLLRKSQMAYEERDGLRVLTLAQAAQYGPWQLPSHIRAEVTLQEARGMAMLGEDVSTVQRKLDEACRVLTRGDTAANGVPTEATLALREASCYVEAGQPRQAVERYERVLSADVLSPRDRGYFLARWASALALAGEPDAAADTGIEAAQVAAAIASRRTTRELVRVLTALEPWRNGRDREPCERQ
jgi:transcriptional regulator with XRE-family HTH domain